MPSATKRTPRADTSRVVVLSRMRSNRDALWVLSERRINSAGAVYTEPAISRTSGGVQGWTSKILMYRPSLLRPDAVAMFAAVSTVRCVRTRAIHRMGSDHRRPCSVHCQRILMVVWLCVFVWSCISVRTACHTGANLSARKARVDMVRPERSHPCTDDRESVCVTYSLLGLKEQQIAIETLQGANVIVSKKLENYASLVSDIERLKEAVGIDNRAEK